MKRSLLFSIGLLLLAATSVSLRAATPTTPVTTEAKTTKFSAAYIKTRLELIYALAFNSIETGRTSVSDYFFSEEFRALYKTAESVTPAGEVGYYDFDPWLRAQDYDDPRAVVNVVNSITQTSAVAQVTIYPVGKSDKGVSVRLRLRFERGDWFIANFDDDLSGLQRYIAAQK